MRLRELARFLLYLEDNLNRKSSNVIFKIRFKRDSPR